VRPHRELWLWLGGLFFTLTVFLTAISIAYFEKDARYSLLLNWWMLGAALAFLAAFTSFFGAIQNWSVPSVPQSARLGFPGIRVEILGTGLMETERDSGSGLAVPTRVRSISARVTNVEIEQHASLVITLYIRLVPGSWGRVGEAVCPPVSWDLSSLGLSAISMPVALAPGATVSGHLVYEIPGYYSDKLAEPVSGRLELWDQVSDRRMAIPAEIGGYDRSEMTPSSGDAELLGPEIEVQADQRGPDLRGPDQRGPDQRGPDQRSMDQRGLSEHGGEQQADQHGNALPA
jgi:hypothetical protein